MLNKIMLNKIACIILLQENISFKLIIVSYNKSKLESGLILLKFMFDIAVYT